MQKFHTSHQFPCTRYQMQLPNWIMFDLVLTQLARPVEFIVWYLKGFQAFDQFSKDRATEDTSPIKEDVYFKLVKISQGNDGGILSAAVFKKAVALVSQMSNGDLSQRAI